MNREIYVSSCRDLLVANTTQEEFKTVLEGICKQTKTFKDECKSIADQYYDIIYEKLTQNLDPNGACFMMGICPKALSAAQSMPAQMMPLVPFKNLKQKQVLGADEPVFSTQEINSFQLPKDVLLLDADLVHQQSIQAGKNGQMCTLCQYVLNFVQEALASSDNARTIKQSVEAECEKLPKNFRGECVGFVDTYGDAIIAMLVQDIDPARVCPKVGLCARQTARNNEKCPMCLFLIKELEETLKGDRSKANIKSKLTGLCSHLTLKLKSECEDFVQTYTDELIDKLSDDFSPEQICLYLKLCTPKEEIIIQHLGDKKSSSDLRKCCVNLLFASFAGYSITSYQALPILFTFWHFLFSVSNAIYQVDSGEDSSEESSEIENPECLLCEKLVKDVEKRVVNDKSKVLELEPKSNKGNLILIERI